MMTPNLAQELQQISLDLKSAVEKQDYATAQSILVRQRVLLTDLDLNDEQAREYGLQSQQLLEWALMMAKLQRSHQETALAAVNRRQQADQRYAAASQKRDALQWEG